MERKLAARTNESIAASLVLAEHILIATEAIVPLVNRSPAPLLPSVDEHEPMDPLRDNMIGTICIVLHDEVELTLAHALPEPTINAFLPHNRIEAIQLVGRPELGQ